MVIPHEATPSSTVVITILKSGECSQSGKYLVEATELSSIYYYL